MKKLKTFAGLILFLFISQTSIAQYTESQWVERDGWMNVSDILDKAGVKKGSFVADIGCHEGYLTVHLANKVQHAGKVYAVDVREDRLAILKDNLKERKLTNVQVIHGDYDDPKLPKNTLDVVIIMDTYHEMDDHMLILKHVYNSLKPGGKIVIIEKLKEHIKGKSRAIQKSAHSLGPKYVRKELLEARFKIDYQNNDIGNWERDTSKVIWMLVAHKK